MFMLFFFYLNSTTEIRGPKVPKGLFSVFVCGEFIFQPVNDDDIFFLYVLYKIVFQTDFE